MLLIPFIALNLIAHTFSSVGLNLIKLDYFKLLKKFKFSHIRSIVFDQMLPRISNYWKREEVENLMRNAGLIDIRLENVNDISWATIGKKPN